MEDGFTSTNTLLVSLCEREHIFYGAGQMPARLPQGDGVIDWSCRDREAAWICSAARRLCLCADSFTLAVAILDRVIYGTRVLTKNKLVYSGYLDYWNSESDEFVRDSSFSLGLITKAFNAQKVFEMHEKVVVGRREVWWSFLSQLVQFLHHERRKVWVAASHIEAIVCDSSVMSQFAPSTLALSVVSLLIEATSRQWMSAIQVQIKLCKTDPRDLLCCRERLSVIWSRTFMPSLSLFELLLPTSEPSSVSSTSCRGPKSMATANHNGQTNSAVGSSTVVADVVITSPRAPQPTPC
ncbi:hypothetical protein Angca_001830 [Angiostrongylus cantonensis]|nr:hypothetical protein Angca_001830 [Angiostrongylus cantonensis]